jgi:hypothetical protein
MIYRSFDFASEFHQMISGHREKKTDGFPELEHGACIRGSAVCILPLFSLIFMAFM